MADKAGDLLNRYARVGSRPPTSAIATSSTWLPMRPSSAGRPTPMTANQHCPHCGNTVKPALTPKRRRRRVENDQYADFLRRALSGYTRRVGQGDIDAIASFSALVAESRRAARRGRLPAARARLLLDRHQPPARHHPSCDRQASQPVAGQLADECRTSVAGGRGVRRRCLGSLDVRRIGSA